MVYAALRRVRFQTSPALTRSRLIFRGRVVTVSFLTGLRQARAASLMALAGLHPWQQGCNA
jgi:hypothetical protein